MRRCAKHKSIRTFTPVAAVVTKKSFPGKSWTQASRVSSCSVKMNAPTRPARLLPVLPSINAPVAESALQHGWEKLRLGSSNYRHTLSQLRQLLDPALLDCEKSCTSRCVIEFVIVSVDRG